MGAAIADVLPIAIGMVRAKPFPWGWGLPLWGLAVTNDDARVSDPAPLTISRAAPADQPVVGALLGEARSWLATAGIEQWTRPFDDDWLAEKITAGEVWIARLEQRAVGVVRLLWTDPLFWGDRDDGTAAYIHTLAVRRAEAGRGIGRAIIEWVAAEARAHGRSAIRLDCAAANRALCAYYEAAGFAPVDRMTVGGEAMLLLQRNLLSTEADRPGSTR